MGVHSSNETSCEALGLVLSAPNNADHGPVSVAVFFREILQLLSQHPYKRCCYSEAHELTTTPAAVVRLNTPSLRGSLKTQGASMGPLRLP